MIKSATFDAASYLQELLSVIPDQARFQIYPLYNARINPEQAFKKPKVYISHYLLWVKGGKGKVIIDDEEVELVRGTLLFVSHGCRMGYTMDPEDLPNIIPVRFRLLEGTDGDDHFPPPAGQGYVLLQPKRVHRFNALLDQLYDCWQQCPEPLASKTTDDLLYALLWAVREEVITSNTTTRDPRMEEARLLFESSRELNLSVADVAKQMNMSESHFSRHFKEQIGVSPKVFQLNSRMRWARLLLTEQNLSVQEVASTLGYSDAFAFSRQFKKTWGISPSKM